MTEKGKKTRKGKGKFLRYFLLALVIIFLAVFTVKRSQDREVTTITKSNLEKVLETSDLSTLEYSYRAVARAYDGEEKTEGNVKYYVAYDGTVLAGIDFSQVKIDVDDEKKEVILTCPPSEIQSVTVDPQSLDFIFKKWGIDKETVSQEAYKLAIEDLEKKAKSNKKILDLAENSAKDSLKGLFLPWVEGVDPEYKVVVK